MYQPFQDPLLKKLKGANHIFLVVHLPQAGLPNHWCLLVRTEGFNSKIKF